MLNSTLYVHNVTRIQIDPVDPLTCSTTDTRKITLHTEDGAIEIIAFAPRDAEGALKLPTDPPRFPLLEGE